MKGDLISLFSGAGGLDIGFTRAGFRVALAADNSPDAIKTYNLNAKRKIARLMDISKCTAKDILSAVPQSCKPIGLIGGPPCQGFSRANVVSRGRDPRNQLPYRYAEFLKIANQKFGLHFFVFENVVGLARKKHRGRFDRILWRLNDAGFNVYHSELDAGGFGVPQRRLRLFIVGLNKRLYPGVDFPFPQESAPSTTVGDVLGALPPPAYFRRGLTVEEIPHHPNHWTMVPRSRKFSNQGVVTGRSFKRLDPKSVSPTVAYGHREVHVHPNGRRRLSVYEAMLLQSFPTDYQLTGSLSAQITQVSNAVPPPVAEAIATAIGKIIGRDDQRGPRH